MTKNSNSSVRFVRIGIHLFNLAKVTCIFERGDFVLQFYFDEGADSVRMKFDSAEELNKARRKILRARG